MRRITTAGFAGAFSTAGVVLLVACSIVFPSRIGVAQENPKPESGSTKVSGHKGGTTLFPNPKEGGGDGKTEFGQVSVEYPVTITFVDDKGNELGTRERQLAIGITGANASKCHLLQLFWEEIFITTDAGDTSHQAGKEKGTSGEYDLTTDPASPKYHLDVAPPATSPFYNGPTQSDAGSEFIFDRPDSTPTVWGPLVADPRAHIEMVIVKDHYEDYLVCDGQFTYEATWDWTTTFIAGGVITRVTSGGGHAVNSLGDAQKAALSDEQKQALNIK
jgi:hypothetical protein